MTYPRETKELQPFRVEVDGVEITEGVKVMIIRPGVRPDTDTWEDPITLDNDRLAVLVDDLELGNWNVWAQVTTTNEEVVVLCGDFKII